MSATSQVNNQKCAATKSSPRAVGQLDLGVPRLRQLVGIVERHVEAARFLAASGALDDQVRDQRQVAELDQVARDLEVEVVLADLVAHDLDAAAGALDALVAPNDPDVR